MNSRYRFVVLGLSFLVVLLKMKPEELRRATSMALLGALIAIVGSAVVGMVLFARPDQVR